ncbi:MAG: hypothetical protein LWW98_09670 [Deltaproteobacteria bacterium]|nr:hypothetical protein [Deltaproteobacteria bacterium]
MDRRLKCEVIFVRALTQTKTDNILYVVKFAMANLKCYQKAAILIMEIVLILQANMGCLHDGYRD